MDRRSAHPDPTAAIAQRLRRERQHRGWSLDELARRAGVSKAMLSKLERCEASPTATLLGRISGALGMTIRSEEHTSELQSPCNLVCRLLLEKKKHCIEAAVAGRPLAIDLATSAAPLGDAVPTAIARTLNHVTSVDHDTSFSYAARLYRHILR